MLRLPPGPPEGRLAQGVRFHRDPLGTLREAQARHGDVFTVRQAVAGPMVVVAAREAVADVVGTDPHTGHAGEARRRILGMVARTSVLGADGAQHHGARGRVQDVFAPAALEGRRPAVERIAERHVRSWPTGRPFRLMPRLRALSDEVFVRLVVGVRDEARAAALVPLIRRMLWTPGYPPLAPPGEGAGATGALGTRAFARRVAPVRALLAAELESRRTDGTGPTAGEGGEDLIGCFVHGAGPPLSTDAALDQLLPILMAGQEPPACALTWLLDRLGREPAWAERFATAPTGPASGAGVNGDGAAAAERDAFVRETLRVRPAVHSIVRRLTAPLEVAGHRLPAGAVAMVPMVLVHRDPVAFPDPDAFRPQRWADGPDERPYLPFGGGARRCVGEPLAHLLIETVLPVAMRELRLRPVMPRPERMVVRGTVLAPVRSALAVASAR